MNFKIFIENEKIMENCTKFIGGWHGLGEIGYITVSTIIQSLNLERIAAIMSSGAPPFISIQNNQLKLPFEIYGSSEYDFAIFIPHLQPYRHVQIDFTEKMANWLLSQNFEYAYFVGGVDKRLKADDYNIQYIPTRQYLSNVPEEFTNEINNQILDPGLFVAGPLAIMLGYLDLNSFKALGLLAYTERERPDPLGSSFAVKKLAELLKTSIPVDDLIQNAKLIEEEIKRQLEPIKETGDQQQGSQFYT